MKISPVVSRRGERVAGGDVVGGFVVGVAVGLADEQHRQAEAEPGVGEAEEERFGTQPVVAAAMYPVASAVMATAP